MVVILKCVFVGYVIIVQSALALNLGLIAGDTKRHTSPLLIKKDYRHSPVFINFHGKSSLSPLKLPELPKPSPDLKSLLKKRSPLLPKLPILPKVPLFLPPLPIIPIIPPLIAPPLIPKLPFFPPIIPKISSLTRLGGPLSSIKVPILGKKSIFDKTLGTELKSLKLPPVNLCKKYTVLDKLKELRKKGSLTTAEFIRFKKLLINK